MFKSLSAILDSHSATTHNTRTIMTGFNSIDHVTGGFSSSSLVLLAARRGNCGSLFIQNLGVAFSKNVPVLFITTEKDLVFAANELNSILDSKPEIIAINEDQKNEVTSMADRIFIDDTSRFVEDVEKTVEKFQEECSGDAVILIDSLDGLFLSKDLCVFTKEQQEAAIVDNLKMLALKFDIPILLLAWIRSGDPAKNAIPPMLYDLSEFENFAHRFDMILSLFHPEYYGIDLDENGDSTENKLIVHLLKSGNSKRQAIRLNISGSNGMLLMEER